MITCVRRWLNPRSESGYARRPSLVLINGLAEQAETWFPNAAAWRRHFDVTMPNLLAYEGEALHRRIEAGLPINVDYLVDQLRLFLDEFVQTPPYHLIANSMGGKIAVEFAVRHPDSIDKLVLLCPSGLSAEERLPVIEGVRRGDAASVVNSVFFKRPPTASGLVEYYRTRFGNRRWRTGLLRTIRGTMDHRVRDRLPFVKAPTLLVVGREDRIVNPQEAITAASLLTNGRLEVLSRCGHAPQIEKAALVNRLAIQFLRQNRVNP